jgi:hypothetical protein
MGLIALAAVNVGIAAGANGGRVAVRHSEIAGAHRAARAMAPPVEVETSFPEVVQARLAAVGVPSRMVPKVGCAEPLVVFASHARICPAPTRPDRDAAGVRASRRGTAGPTPPGEAAPRQLRDDRDGTQAPGSK